MAYIKPQYPLKSGDNYLYPVTTADQIIMNDGQRLSGVGVYLDKPKEGEDTTMEAGVNAATLGGILPSEFVLKTDVIENAANAVNAENANNSYAFSGYAFEEMKSLMLNLAHPVGSYYWSKEATEPSILFGGTWEQIKDQFILAAGDSYVAGSTGGEATHKLTKDELPKIEGYAYVRACENTYRGIVGTSGVFSATLQSNAASTLKTEGSGNADRLTLSFGNDQSHNNMPPYRVAYCWCRTA